MPEFSNALMWFRRDLRTRDHTALYHALRAARQVHCLFVFDPALLAPLPADDRRVAFIHASLAALGEALHAAGGQLWIARGDPAAAVPAAVRALGADALFFNHDYEPAARRRDATITAALTAEGCAVRSFKDQAILERDEVLTGSRRPYSVFTPYKRSWLQTAASARAFDPWPSERHLDRLAPRAGVVPDAASTDAACDFLAPRLPTLAELGFAAARAPTAGGEEAALRMLEDFEPRIDDYHRTRDFPGLAATSGLSVHLRHGTLSVRALARTAYAAAQSARARAGAETWLSELAWRDFFFQVLHHHPRLVEKDEHRAFRPEYDAIQWETGDAADDDFAAWCEARTGYPLVDAAMRQINQTGFMHNRLRMVVATFLCKDLGVDWRRGEAYFARQLNDFDLSANNGNWQWAASSGCDAQPWFRIFNPLTQSAKFDADGTFIRRYVPELAALDNTAIHAPWLAKAGVLARAGIELGRDYPHPLVDHALARERTLERYAVVKSARARDAVPDATADESGDGDD
ncbi:deoxyribodipyrimidine photo-lyase [Robbsia sp. Bb-Pol-6]|uniref:Deoxyribodipyrimidine photo-lyase n=1 Tax=Robbsia betulipollinis TaxID=2981849 RepID=A0ABT3ZLX0_9BURK|nr:deoxyribodipyrimidine photo-lyase [Robbsia betulipollinis]MCY0387536.1 deoxyribodipyrimidine photo-lyase [Robbsia betulipollinis]